MQLYCIPLSCRRSHTGSMIFTSGQWCQPLKPPDIFWVSCHPPTLATPSTGWSAADGCSGLCSRLLHAAQDMLG